MYELSEEFGGGAIVCAALSWQTVRKSIEYQFKEPVLELLFLDVRINILLGLGIGFTYTVDHQPATLTLPLQEGIIRVAFARAVSITLSRQTYSISIAQSVRLTPLSSSTDWSCRAQQTYPPDLKFGWALFQGFGQSFPPRWRSP